MSPLPLEMVSVPQQAGDGVVAATLRAEHLQGVEQPHTRRQTCRKLTIEQPGRRLLPSHQPVTPLCPLHVEPRRMRRKRRL